MNHFTKSLLSVALIALTILIVNCKGDQGDPGPQAANGTNGANGKNGTNGTNGVGFDDAVSRGGVTVYLDGKRPDGIAFKDTLSFGFSSANLDYSNAYWYMPADSDVSTYIKRYTGLNGVNSDETNSAEVWGEVWFRTQAATKGDTSKYTELRLYADISFPAEGKYFRIDGDDYYFESYYGSDGTKYSDGSTGLSDSTFTGYKYDSLSGSLKNKVSFVVAAGYNATGYDLKVTYITAATVYQQVPTVNSGRIMANGKRGLRTSSPSKVAKAEMQPMK